MFANILFHSSERRRKCLTQAHTTSDQFKTDNQSHLLRPQGVTITEERQDFTQHRAADLALTQENKIPVFKSVSHLNRAIPHKRGPDSDTTQR